MTIESEGLGIPGTKIDLEKDLGVADGHFPALSVQLRPARSHHLRCDSIRAHFGTHSVPAQRSIGYHNVIF